MKLNDISDADEIVIGQKLKLPAGTKPAIPLAWTQPAAAPQLTRPSQHTVRSGETLTSIAAQYGLEPGALARANQFGPSDRPQIGQKLKLSASNDSVAQVQRQTPDPTTTASVPKPNLKPPAPATERKVVTAAPAPPVSEPVQQAATQSVSEGTLDFRWPVRGKVIAEFGPQPSGGTIEGIKISVPQGTPVRASESGVVAYAGSELKPYGNLVLIRHEGGYVTAYAHNSDLTVKNGETIKRGQIIAHAGQTGSVSQPQVHFEIRKNKKAVDPTEYLSSN